LLIKKAITPVVAFLFVGFQALLHLFENSLPFIGLFSKSIAYKTNNNL